MAGRLPGVGLPSRRRSDSGRHHRHQHHAAYAMEFEAPWISSSVSSMDEAALEARQRLQQKLGHFSWSSSSSSSSSSLRSSYSPTNEGNGKENTTTEKKKKKKAGLGLKLLEQSWLSHLKGHKKERKVCAVCLEDFKEEEKVIKLSCSHKYHSACLLPWLEAHGNCPYCRTPVHS